MQRICSEINFASAVSEHEHEQNGNIALENMFPFCTLVCKEVLCFTRIHVLVYEMQNYYTFFFSVI
jgi:hypothetical protein